LVAAVAVVVAKVFEVTQVVAMALGVYDFLIPFYIFL
jgi:hypothetical protein